MGRLLPSPLRRGRRGYVLLLSLAVLLILFTIGAALLNLANTNLRLSQRRTEGAQALQLAIGGMDEAIAALKKSSSYAGFSARMMGAGNVAVSVTTPSGQPSRRVVVSTGTVTGRGYIVRRSVRTACSAGSVPPVFLNAIAAKETLTINGNVSVDSAPATGQGHVHSNADVVLTGTPVSVDGRATAGGNVSTSGNPTVTGGMTSGAPVMTFPEVDPTLEDQALALGSIVPSGGTHSVNNQSTAVTGRIAGNLTVGSNGCTLSGIVWVTGNVTIGGPVVGKGTLVTEGTLTLDAKSTYPSTDVSNLLFITLSTSSSAVDLGGNRSFKGSIYAPEGGIRLHGTPSLFGSLIGNTITFSGTPNITRWTNFDQSPPYYPSYFQVEGWEEM